MGELHAIGPRKDLVEHLEQLVEKAKEGKIKAITYALVLDTYACKPGWYGVSDPTIPQTLLGYAMRSSVNYLASAMDEAAAQ